MTSYRLISEDVQIPNHKIGEGETLTLGRNKECKIKHVKCSRNYCTVEAKESKLIVRYKTGQIEHFKSNQVIQGPGFSYRVKIVDTSQSSNSNTVSSPLGQNNESNSNVTTESNDGTISWSEDASKKILIGKYRGGGNESALIAAFDFDSTLVSPKSGKAFPINGDDWKLVDPQIPKLISSITEKGYRFVIISNQMGISTGKTDIREVKKRFNDSVKAIGAPCLVLISTEDDLYRKPRIGLWSHLVEAEQPSVSVDYDKSFYVGDAAGRKKTALHKGDHSLVDLYFALNAGLKFMVPEDFFRSAKNIHSWVPNSAKSFLNSGCFKPTEPADDYILEDLSKKQNVTQLESVLPKSKHCIIFCGMSASGKSTFYQEHLSALGYEHISCDELGSMLRCESKAKSAFSKGTNCVIDNTNVDKKSRAKWIDLCQKNGYIPIVFYFKLPLSHIFHNNLYRKLTGKQQNVTSLVIHTQKKKFEEPTADESPNNVFVVNFVPSFRDDLRKKLYYMYLNEKIYT